jgi:hypothetical protein
MKRNIGYEDCVCLSTTRRLVDIMTKGKKETRTSISHLDFNFVASKQKSQEDLLKMSKG